MKRKFTEFAYDPVRGSLLDSSASPSSACLKKMGIEIDANEVFSSFPGMTVDSDDHQESDMDTNNVRIKFWFPGGNNVVQTFSAQCSVQVHLKCGNRVTLD